MILMSGNLEDTCKTKRRKRTDKWTIPDYSQLLYLVLREQPKLEEPKD